MTLKRRLRNFAAYILSLVITRNNRLKTIIEALEEEKSIIPVVLHNPEKVLFRKLIKWLKDNDFDFISSDELYNYITHNSSPDIKSVWLSFDDGWQGNLANVFPVLIEYQIPATFFIASGSVETGNFWFELAEHDNRISSEQFKILWKIPENERKAICKPLFLSPLNGNGRKALTKQDLLTMTASPLVTIGSHTVNHVICPNCTKEELSFELSESRSFLAFNTGMDINYFAYPNGDFDRTAELMALEKGYKMAFTVEQRFIRKNENPYALPRIPVMDNGSLRENLTHIFCLWQPVVNKFKQAISFNQSR